MDRNIFRALATAFRAMELPPADAGFEDLLTRLEAVPGTRDAANASLPAIACAMGDRSKSHHPRRNGAALAA